MKRLLAFWILAVAQAASAFTYTDATSGGHWTKANADGLDTALDTLEADRTTLFGAKFIVETPVGALTNALALSTLANGILVNATGTGIPTIYAGATCTNQFVRALNPSGTATCATVQDADIVTGITRDTEATETCVGTKQVFSPYGGAIIGIYKVPFQTTLTRYSAYVMPTTATETVTVRLEECTPGQQSCTFNDAAYTANSDGATEDTAFSDATISANAEEVALVGTPSADMGADTLYLNVCYSRQVVQ